MICLFVINSQSYLTVGDKQSFSVTIVAFIVYAVVGIVVSSMVQSSLVEFMITMVGYDDIAVDAVNGLQADVRLSEDAEKKKEKIAIEIPEFLFKYSSTFFKTATKKDILFKKLFSKTKESKKPTEVVSARLKAKADGAKEGVQGKTMKKTDLSMINFHLNVKDNDELLKHYR